MEAEDRFGGDATTSATVSGSNNRGQVDARVLSRGMCRYFDNQRVQEDARRIEEYFRNAGYGIVYRDVVNTVFIRSDLKPAGGD